MLWIGYTTRARLWPRLASPRHGQRATACPPRAEAQPRVLHFNSFILVLTQSFDQFLLTVFHISKSTERAQPLARYRKSRDHVVGLPQIMRSGC